MSTMCRVAVPAAIVLAGAGWQVARAQEVPAAEQAERSSVIEEITVTAQRREESLQDTPIAMSTFSADDLDAHKASNFMDISAFTPNFTAVNTTGSNNNVAASIRGIFSQEPALAQEPKVGFYLDGVYLAKNSGAIFDLADLERIEILRGPQGTLYGKNTTGGAINLISSKPTGEFGVKQLLSTGNLNRITSRTNLNLPAWGPLSAKLSYLSSQRDGTSTNRNPNTPVREMGDEDTQSFRIALRWKPGDAWTADYSFDRTDSSSAPKPPQLSHVNPAYADVPVVTSFDPYTEAEDNPFRQLIAAGVVSPDRRIDHFSLDAVQREDVVVSGHNLTVAWQLGAAELRAITGYREYDSDADPGARGAEDFDGGDWVVPIFHLGTPASDGIRKQQDQFSQELQIVGSAFNNRLTYVGGLYYFSESGSEFSNEWDALLYLPAGTIPGLDFDALYPQSLILGGPPNGLGEFYAVENRSRAVYTQVSYTPEAFSDRLTLSGGLRYTEDDREATLLDADPVWRAEKSWSNLSPSVSAQYALSETVGVYGKIASGYNAGNFPVRASTETAFGIPVDEETLVAYEVGVKSDWLDRRLRVNTAAFLYKYDDLQVSDFQAGSTILVNAGKATVSGFELEVTAIPFTGLTALLGYGYTNFEYDEFIVGGVDLADTAVPSFAPEHTASASLEYVFPGVPFGQLALRSDVSYSDSYTFETFATLHDKATSRTLVDARLALREIPVGEGSLEVALWGKNLTDKEYREFGVDFSDLGFAVNTWGDRRMYGLDLIYRFQ